MTEEKFKKLCFKHSMLLEYIEPRTGFIIPCILTEVDFDEGILTVFIIPNDMFKGDEYRQVSYKHIELPKPQMKALK